MSRPDDRPLRRLPQLEARKADLERCVFCPKLCRSACPVSNADTRETVTPWGKMSMAYFVANESVALAPSFAQPAWACTGCFGCREHCDHENDVTGTLFEARSALASAGVAPPAARRVLERFDPRAALGKMQVPDVVLASAKTMVLVGCEHARRGTQAGVDTVRATAKLTNGKVCLAEECCGAPLLYAGDKKRFDEQARRFAEHAARCDRVVVGDAGCAAAIRVHSAHKTPPVLHFSELAAREVVRLKRLDVGATVRWHDPCQLGRGLGVYEAPRQVLARVLGRAPAEFSRARDDARCSGAGGLLPLTMPDVARGIADQRVADHRAEGGGTIVTACASSARSFERSGATVLDLATVVLRALEP
ncbi:MAG: (Fe-S)-binding protein [Labilithrix sp.]|nr:(Fe-S)-binding protein [Labilithrix sp.]MCW5811196.1 (Fe-S)-binding protein [Labilithrix sp.]